MSTFDMPEDYPNTQEGHKENNNEEVDKENDNRNIDHPAMVTDHISSFADVNDVMQDMNSPVKFQGRDGTWIVDDFLAAFPPNSLKQILVLTNQNL
jgi:hypothetical protein